MRYGSLVGVTAKPLWAAALGFTPERLGGAAWAPVLVANRATSTLATNGMISLRMAGK
jgi:hypothetical protein